MKKTLLAVALLLASVWVVLTQTEAQAANLLENPGFESGTLAPWSCSAGSVVTTPVHSGARALAGAASGSDTAQCTQQVAVRPGTPYTLTAWVRGGYVYLGVNGGPSTWTSSQQYTQLSLTFTTAANQSTAVIYLHGWYGQGTYYADDVGLDGPGQPPTSTPTVTPTPTPTSTTCPLKPRPAGKVLQGYWENWDGAANGVHPPLGWIPITDSRIAAHGYNVINAAFPVIRSDGTALWEDGMDATVKVATPAEMCQAKAAGATILMSIGGAAAGIDLNSSAVADRFVATIVPILKQYNFDGIDIDIETGLTGSGSIGTLSASQANLIRVIDGVLAQMPAGFGLTMAPETAYVTGGSVTYGSIWGAYLPIIKKYADNGRLWWLNMQYYNGSMYGCAGDSYQAGTVEGFVRQTTCLNDGLTIQGTTIRVPYDKQVPGLPAQPGAGGGYMSTGLVKQSWNSFGGALKGLMTWSVNWDGSRGWTFGDNFMSL
ncbi:carbohydrate binding domain-containing protein [Nonomuraea sediminis]|uniref:carbohydrate binding domain-containing protein n=1 Tax=Nonomuraea sediminis TaxID=2835864 RepID=UPI001BDC6AB7|nr:glycosyl hydrolase family 18 protein [Nonomuraea sediminis]